MKAGAFLFVLQDWWTNWLGETSAIQWIGLFIAGLLAVSFGCAIYWFSLKGHIRKNRYPSALRWLSLFAAAALAMVFYTVVFWDVLLRYVMAVIGVVCIILLVVFFFSSRKVATR